MRPETPAVSERPVTIFIDHGEAYGNLGDEAMLIAATSRIRSVYPNVRFLLPKSQDGPLPNIGEPFDMVTPPSHLLEEGVTWLKRFWIFHRFSYFFRNDRRFRIAAQMLLRFAPTPKYRAFRNQIQSCAAVYFVGAANFNDIGRLVCLLPRYLLFLEARKQGVPVIISSQTIGPLELDWTKHTVRLLALQSRFFSVRDGGVSHRLFETLGVPLEKVPFTGDEAFSLQPASADEIDSYLKETSLEPDTKPVLFHFRATDYTQNTEKFYARLAGLLDTIPDMYPVCFLPMSYGEHSGKDEICGEAIRALMKHPEKCHILPSTENVRIVRALVERSRAVFSLSYHVQVFALAAAKPLLILTCGDYYRVKSQGMRDLAGALAPVIALDQDDEETLLQTFQAWMKDWENQKPALRELRGSILNCNDLPLTALENAIEQSR